MERSSQKQANSFYNSVTPDPFNLSLNSDELAGHLLTATGRTNVRMEVDKLKRQEKEIESYITQFEELNQGISQIIERLEGDNSQEARRLKVKFGEIRKRNDDALNLLSREQATISKKLSAYEALNKELAPPEASTISIAQRMESEFSLKLALRKAIVESAKDVYRDLLSKTEIDKKRIHFNMIFSHYAEIDEQGKLVIKEFTKDDIFQEKISEIVNSMNTMLEIAAQFGIFRDHPVLSRKQSKMIEDQFSEVCSRLDALRDKSNSIQLTPSFEALSLDVLKEEYADHMALLSGLGGLVDTNDEFLRENSETLEAQESVIAESMKSYDKHLVERLAEKIKITLEGVPTENFDDYLSAAMIEMEELLRTTKESVRILSEQDVGSELIKVLGRYDIHLSVVDEAHDLEKGIKALLVKQMLPKIIRNDLIEGFQQKGKMLGGISTQIIAHQASKADITKFETAKEPFDDALIDFREAIESIDKIKDPDLKKATLDAYAKEMGIDSSASVLNSDALQDHLESIAKPFQEKNEALAERKRDINKQVNSLIKKKEELESREDKVRALCMPGGVYFIMNQKRLQHFKPRHSSYTEQLAAEITAAAKELSTYDPVYLSEDPFDMDGLDELDDRVRETTTRTNLAISGFFNILENKEEIKALLKDIESLARLDANVRQGSYDDVTIYAFEDELQTLVEKITGAFEALNQKQTDFLKSEIVQAMIGLDTEDEEEQIIGKVYDSASDKSFADQVSTFSQKIIQAHQERVRPDDFSKRYRALRSGLDDSRTQEHDPSNTSSKTDWQNISTIKTMLTSLKSILMHANNPKSIAMLEQLASTVQNERVKSVIGTPAFKDMVVRSFTDPKYRSEKQVLLSIDSPELFENHIKDILQYQKKFQTFRQKIEETVFKVRGVFGFNDICLTKGDSFEALPKNIKIFYQEVVSLLDADPFDIKAAKALEDKISKFSTSQPEKSKSFARHPTTHKFYREMNNFVANSGEERRHPDPLLRDSGNSIR